MIPRYATDKVPRRMDAATWNAMPHKARWDYLNSQMPTWEELQAVFCCGGMGIINPGDTIYVRPQYVPYLRELSNMMSLGLDVQSKTYNTADWKETP